MSDEMVGEAEADRSDDLQLNNLGAAQVSGQSTIELTRSTSSQLSRRSHPRTYPLGYVGKEAIQSIDHRLLIY